VTSTDPYRYRPARFFLLTLLATWVPWVIAIAIQSDARLAHLASTFTSLGLLAPFVVTLVLVGTSGHRALKRDFRDRLIDLSRIRPVYVLVAIAMPLSVMVLSILISLGLGQSRDQLRFSASPGLMGMIVLALVAAPIIEELGWRGYGVDSLRAKMGTLGTSLSFGVLWSLWHAPLVLIHGTYHHDLAQMANPLFLVNFFVGVVPAAVLANWLYYRNDRSILVGIGFHSMLNAAAVLPNATQVTKCIVTVVYALIAVVVVLADRTVFGAGPRNFVANGSATPGARS
jgi:CAAX protease family protein